jgi:ATP-dependent Clp protease ATP-binding subunit ClpA
MVKVVNKFIAELSAQVKEKGIKIKIDKSAIELLIEKGFDSKMGARPLQRTIDQLIKRPLSKMMLFGELKNGGHLTIGSLNGEITLTKRVKIVKPLLLENETQPENTSQEN